MKFKEFHNDYRKMQEETNAGDIAGVDNKLDTGGRKKGKKCKKHKRVSCKNCEEERYG